MANSAADREELRQSEKDQAYWTAVGAPLGLLLYGWTYRNTATFISEEDASKTVKIDGWLAERLLEVWKDRRPRRKSDRAEIVRSTGYARVGR